MKHKRLCEEGFGEKGNYTIILPIDQGVEHGPVDAFYATDHPEMLDIDYQVDFIRDNNLEERFNRYWKYWQKMLEARGVDKWKVKMMYY